jgi:hypothetical protein
MLRGDAHTKGLSPAAKARLRFQPCRPPVDAGGDQAVGSNLERRRGPLVYALLNAADRVATSHRDPEQTRRQSAGEQRIRAHGRAGTGRWSRAPSGSYRDRPELRVPAAVALNGSGVHPERNVVDEHAVVGLSGHDALTPVCEGVA